MAARHGTVQLSTGDMLRAAVAAGTPVGRKAADLMARGELVPDDVVVSIVADRIEQPDAAHGFVLDGFPRTVPQAEALDRMLARKGLALDAVIELKVDEAALVRRIATRAAEMRAMNLEVRADDTPEVLQQRLEAYRALTAPLTAYYENKGSLRTVDGMASIEAVTEAISKILAGAAQASADRRNPATTSRAASRRSAVLRSPLVLPRSDRGENAAKSPFKASKTAESGASNHSEIASPALRRPVGGRRKAAGRPSRARRLTK